MRLLRGLFTPLRAIGSWLLQPPDAPVMRWPNETGEDA